MSVYRALNLSPIINASGTVTRLGGAPMPREVLEAFVAAADETVPLEALQAKASARVASITRCEAGLVTGGASAALTLGTAAILARFDVRRMERLPVCDGFPNEFLIAREHRNGYDHAVRAAGARLVEVGFNEVTANAGVRRTEVWDYESAITPQTAGVLFVESAGSRALLTGVVGIAHSRNIPVLVDAAGELPPRENLWQIPATGADLVAFSGGKAIRGPQSTGILCGRRDLVASAALQMLDMDDHPELWDPPAAFIDRDQLPAMPRHGIGRSLKVSKEEIVAALTALEMFAAGCFDADVSTWRAELQQIAASLEGAGASCRLFDSLDGQTPPVLEILLAGPDAGQLAFDMCRRLRNGDPPVYVGHGKLAEGILVIRPTCLRPAHIEPLTRRLLECLKASPLTSTSLVKSREQGYG